MRDELVAVRLTGRLVVRRFVTSISADAAVVMLLIAGP